MFEEPCNFCRELWEPDILPYGGVGKLKEFKGYTVDIRARQFRKIIPGKPFEFIFFHEPKGQTLLKQMHKQMLKVAVSRNK